MSPLQFFLFLTFLIYSFYYKFALFLIYSFLVVSYSIYCIKISPEADGLNVPKQKTLTACFSNHNEGSAHIQYELDVTQSMAFAAKLSKEHDIPVTITHVALRALALGIRVFKWGSFESDNNVGLTTLVNVDGKDVVLFTYESLPSKKNEQDGVKSTQKTRQGASKAIQFTPLSTQFVIWVHSSMIQISTHILAYVINKLNIPIPVLGLKARDFGNGLVSNVGVFKFKRGYSPLIQQSGCSILIAMGMVEKRAVVRDNKVVPRQMMNFNFSFDSRFGSFENFRPCYSLLKQYFENPESFENSASIGYII